LVGSKIRLKNQVNVSDSDSVLELDSKWKDKVGVIQEIDHEDFKIILESGEKFWINHKFCEVFSKN
jgi:hypothetical protein